MNYRVLAVVDRINRIVRRTNLRTAEGQATAKDLQAIIRIANHMAEDLADIEGELDLMRRQYANYPPMPLDDDWYNEYYERYEKED